MEYYEVRLLKWSELMSLCVKNYWYTNAENEDYERLRDSLCEGQRDLNTEAIIAIAEEIASHSVEIWTVEEIANAVAGICEYRFFQAEPPDRSW